jgi:hypothetical protein
MDVRPAEGERGRRAGRGWKSSGPHHLKLSCGLPLTTKNHHKRKKEKKEKERKEAKMTKMNKISINNQK